MRRGAATNPVLQVDFCDFCVFPLRLFKTRVGSQNFSSPTSRDFGFLRLKSMALSAINESSRYEDVSSDMVGRIRTGRADSTKTRTKNHSFLTGYYLDHRSLTW